MGGSKAITLYFLAQRARLEQLISRVSRLPQDGFGYVESIQLCPEGTLYNPVAKVCDWAASVCALNVCPNDCP